MASQRDADVITRGRCARADRTINKRNGVNVGGNTEAIVPAVPSTVTVAELVTPALSEPYSR